MYSKDYVLLYNLEANDGGHDVAGANEAKGAATATAMAMGMMAHDMQKKEIVRGERVKGGGGKGRT